MLMIELYVSVFFFFNDTATTEIYTLSLHDALPIFHAKAHAGVALVGLDVDVAGAVARGLREQGDRKSTRLNSSHLVISYAVFCLKKKTMVKHYAHIPSYPRSVCLTVAL